MEYTKKDIMDAVKEINNTMIRIENKLDEMEAKRPPHTGINKPVKG